MATSRREFLTTAGRVVVALPAGWVFLEAAGCGGYSSKNNNNACTGAGGVSVTATTITSTSTCVLGHVHMTSVERADAATPPAGGVTVETSETESHTHEVTLTEAQLQAVNAGDTVTVTSSTTDDHSHVFTIRTTAVAGTTPSSGGY